MRLINDFYHSNHDLLLEGIRLQYMYFYEAKFITDTYRRYHKFAQNLAYVGYHIFFEAELFLLVKANHHSVGAKGVAASIN